MSLTCLVAPLLPGVSHLQHERRRAADIDVSDWNTPKGLRHEAVTDLNETGFRISMLGTCRGAELFNGFRRVNRGRKETWDSIHFMR